VFYVALFFFARSGIAELHEYPGGFLVIISTLLVYPLTRYARMALCENLGRLLVNEELLLMQLILAILFPLVPAILYQASLGATFILMTLCTMFVGIALDPEVPTSYERGLLQRDDRWA
jgi:hypothetical protein